MMSYRNKQQGVVLVVALIALTAISLAGISLMRTVDTSNVVSGNMAFKETALQMADVGAERAYLDILWNLLSNTSGCQFVQANCPVNSAGKGYLYPDAASINSVTKLPSTAGGLFWSDPVGQPMPGDVTASYSTQYIIERMCGAAITGIAGDDTGNMQVRPTFAKCRAAPAYSLTGVPVAGIGKLFYRVTVRVLGPRNTISFSQYFFGVQDTVI